jgi:signal transduction histidine kinase
MTRVSGPRIRGGTRPAGAALVQAALGLVVFAGVEATLLVTGPVQPTWVVLAFPSMALLYGAAGLAAWARRPRNRIGALLVFGAWTWMVAGLANVDDELLVAVGQLAATLPFAVIVHLVLAFPSGRLPDRASQATVAGAYVVTTVLEAPRRMFVHSAPAEPLLVRLDPQMDALAQLVQGAGALAVVLMSSALVIRNLRHTGPAARRGALPLLVYGIVAVVAVPLSASVIQPLAGIDPLTRVVAQLVVLAVVPVAFAVAVLRGGFARVAELDELAVRLGSAGPVSLRSVLVDALGDPSVQVGMRVSASGRDVDEDGRALPDQLRADEVQVDVDVAGRRVGLIRYSSQAVHDRDLVVSAGRVLALAIDARRLDLELVTANAELRRSQARLVAAADDERRRIATDLHDGAQGRLVVLGMLAQRVVDRIEAGDPARAVGEAVEVRDGLVAAIDEMRALVQGVMPSLLMEAGLAAATADLVDRMPIRTELDAPDDLRALAAPVESTAYLVVAESLANGLKHSGATHMKVVLRDDGALLRVEVSDDGVGGATTENGSGIRSLADRVAALGGRLRVDSRLGHGTRVVAEVPCGS